MREIQLTQGKVAIVDADDFERLNAFKWYANRRGQDWSASRAGIVGGKQRVRYMHRLILNTPTGSQVDHINGNKLDNRKESLRNCTNQQNCFNKKNPSKNNKLGIKGICWHKTIKKFQAKIRVNNKLLHLGYFNVMGDADSAYRIAEEKYFGEFARNYYKGEKQ